VSPAQAIKDQFKMASDLLSKNPKDLPVWLPILQQYGPSLLVEVDNAMELSRDLVTQWLVGYMFAGDPEAKLKADTVATYFADHNRFKTHARRIGLKEIQENNLPLKIFNLEKEPALHRLVLRLYAAISHTFAYTPAYKMYENSQGQALFRMIQLVVQRAGPPTPSSPPGGKKKK